MMCECGGHWWWLAKKRRKILLVGPANGPLGLIWNGPKMAYKNDGGEWERGKEGDAMKNEQIGRKKPSNGSCVKGKSCVKVKWPIFRGKCCQHGQPTKRIPCLLMSSNNLRNSFLKHFRLKLEHNYYGVGCLDG